MNIHGYTLPNPQGGGAMHPWGLGRV